MFGDVQICKHTWANMHTETFTHPCLTHVHIHTYTHINTYVHTYTHTHVPICTHTHVPICQFTHAFAHMRMYNYTCIPWAYIHIHTYALTYTHAYDVRTPPLPQGSSSALKWAGPLDTGALNERKCALAIY